MEYEELKDLVRQSSTKNEEHKTMTKKMEEIYDYLSDISKKIMTDLELSYPQSAISTGSNSVWTSVSIHVSDRQIRFFYNEDGLIKVFCYEPGVIENTLIDTLVYKEDGQVIREETNKQFKLDDIKEYLEWFKK